MDQLKSAIHGFKHHTRQVTLQARWLLATDAHAPLGLSDLAFEDARPKENVFWDGSEGNSKR